MTEIPKQYRSKTPAQAMAHLGEELSEAATAAFKALRFGFDSVNPELPSQQQETNLGWLRREMRDVVRAYMALGEQIGEGPAFRAQVRNVLQFGEGKADD